MKRTILICFVIGVIPKLYGQLGPIELMAGDKYMHYQHALGQPIKPDSRFGWQHFATLIKRHNNKKEKGGMPDELMNQAYLTYRVNRFFSLKGGLFYTNVGGYQPSFSIQFSLNSKPWLVLIAPRIDLKQNGAYELFTSIEYSPRISKNLRWYSRVQAMSSITKVQHNRSYQLLRVGLDHKGVQFGAGVTLDEYGRNPKLLNNMGIFVRRML